MLSFIPLHLAATTRSPAVLQWCKSWLGEDAVLLTPEDWYKRDQGIKGWETRKEGLDYPVIKKGKWIWCPAPAAADVAICQLRLARLKRTESTHVFICPKLMLPLWKRSLHKVADVVLECKAGQAFWPASAHEPLIIGLCFPFIRFPPWQIRNSPALLGVERLLRSVWGNREHRATQILKSTCKSCWKLKELDRERCQRLLSGCARDLLAFRRGKKRSRSESSN